MENATENPLSPVGSDTAGGRAPDGRFARGNKAAKGNPTARKAQQLRVALMRAVGAGDVRRIVASMVKAAIAGDVQAAKLILERTLGPALPYDVEERLALLEGRLRGAKP